MQPPKFTLDDVRYAEGAATFQRARDLYESGKVGPVKEDKSGYHAIVNGTQPYRVTISNKRVDVGSCECYLGQNDRLCKHMLALALAVLHPSGKTDTDNIVDTKPHYLIDTKKQVVAGMRKIRAYTGPSRIWFSYQRSLATGAGMITDAIKELYPSRENVVYLWRLVERLDKKLVNGVDDSDGVVGECISQILEQLAIHARLQPGLEPVIRDYCGRKTGFGFEEDLRRLLDKTL